MFNNVVNTFIHLLLYTVANIQFNHCNRYCFIMYLPTQFFYLFFIKSQCNVNKCNVYILRINLFLKKASYPPQLNYCLNNIPRSQVAITVHLMLSFHNCWLPNN